MPLVVYLSFFPPFPLTTTNSQTVSGRELEGIPTKRVPIAMGHQSRVVIPGSSLVIWEPPIF